MSDDALRSTVEGAELVFRLADPDDELTDVRLWQDLGLPADVLGLERVDGGWELRLPRPTVHRMEYLFELSGRDGARRTATDPTNPRLVDGAFGAHSVLELPGYVAPAWLDVQPVDARIEPLTVGGTTLGDVSVQVWSPADTGPADPLPLLLAHDGPELVAYAALDRFIGAMVAAGELPRMRLALVEPGERNVWYSADLDYAAALTHRVLPAVRDRYACAPDVVLAGASLGGLAALHAEWAHPGTFAGLLCQSGSFFTEETDPQEVDFSGFTAVSSFVQRVLRAETPPSLPFVSLTCGSVEENVHNNRVLAARLDALGIEVSYAEHPDVHSYTSWRDVLDPHLTALLQRVWG